MVNGLPVNKSNFQRNFVVGLINLASLLLLGSMVLWQGISLGSQNFLQSLLLIPILLGAAAAWLLRQRDTHLAAQTLVVTCGALLFINLIDTHATVASFYWAFAYLVVVVFLVPFKLALIWGSTLIAMILGVSLWQQFQGVVWRPDFYVQFIPALVIEFILLLALKTLLLRDRDASIDTYQELFNELKLIDSKVPMLLLDQYGDVQQANDAFCNLFGSCGNAFTNKSLQSIGFERPDEGVFNWMPRDGEWKGVLVAASASGRKMWLKTVIYEQNDVYGEVQGFLVMLSDESRFFEFLNYANYDSLTGAYKPMVFLDLLSHKLHAFQRYETDPSALIFVEIKGLDKVSSTYVGQRICEVIKHFHAQMKEVLPSNTIIAKWSQYSFIVLVPKTDSDSLLETVAFLKSDLQQKSLQKGLRLSAMISLTDFIKGDSIENLMERLGCAIELEHLQKSLHKEEVQKS